MFDKTRYIWINNQSEYNVIKAAEQLSRMNFKSGFAKKILILKYKTNELQYLLHFPNGINFKQMIFCVNYFKYPRRLPKFGDVRGYWRITPQDGIGEEFTGLRCMLFVDNYDTKFNIVNAVFERSIKTLQLTIGELQNIKELEPGAYEYQENEFISYDFEVLRLIDSSGSKKNNNSMYPKKDNSILILLAVFNLLVALIPFAGLATIVGSIMVLVFAGKSVAARVLGIIAISLSVLVTSVIMFIAVQKSSIMMATGYQSQNYYKSQQNLNRLVSLIEKYKKENGNYPESLGDLDLDYNTTLNDETYIIYRTNKNDPVYRQVYYRLDDSSSYYLSLPGIDGMPNTDDDILPYMTKEAAQKTGLEKFEDISGDDGNDGDSLDTGNSN